VENLNDPARIDEIRRLIDRKRSLRRFYGELYRRFGECLKECPTEGIALELGSGGGFIKEVLPQVVTSDVIPYPGVDHTLDATRMDLDDESLRAIFMINVFHHIPDVEAFFREAIRCLKPGGRILLVDQHPGWISAPILKYVHHEPYDAHTSAWAFDSTGPLSDANGALAWIVFRRDQELFQKRCPQLRMLRYQPHSPLRYWLSGGLKSWNLLPDWAFNAATGLDSLLVRMVADLGSFTDIELVKQ
jgi:SAM-dependent methyltransferase